jgi:hypothetical protein
MAQIIPQAQELAAVVEHLGLARKYFVLQVQVEVQA